MPEKSLSEKIRDILLENDNSNRDGEITIDDYNINGIVDDIIGLVKDEIYRVVM